MRIVCISDTHGLVDDLVLPEGDVLVHAGDMSMQGSDRELILVGEWFAKQPHKHKVVIAGNHDWGFFNDRTLAVSLLKQADFSDSIRYLQDGACTIDGVKFYGSPWQPEFCDWAFNLPRSGAELRDVWDRIPGDTDVLITHGPPKGVLDLVIRRMPGGARYKDLTGCELLYKRVQQVRPKVHVFGHIHEGAGQLEKGGVTFVNAATCTRRYKPTNPPIVIDL